MTARKADIMLLLASMLWGSGFIGTDIGLRLNLTPMQLIAGRFVLAALLMGLLFHKQLSFISRLEWKAGCILGTFTAVGFFLQTIGLQYTSVSNNAFLTSTSVILVPFLFWITSGIHPDKYSVISAGIALFGIFLLTGGGISIGKGDFITLGGALFYACNMIAAGKFMKHCSPLHVSFVQFFTVAGLSLLAALIEKKPVHFSTGAAAACLYLAVLATILTYLLQNFAFKYTSPTKGSVILSLESVFGSLLAVALFHDPLPAMKAFGCLIIFSAILFAELKPAFSLPSVPLPFRHHPHPKQKY